MTARELEPILAPTYGCIVYQEQVMQIVRDLPGTVMGEVTRCRAMSKKKQMSWRKKRIISSMAMKKLAWKAALSEESRKKWQLKYLMI